MRRLLSPKEDVAWTAAGAAVDLVSPVLLPAEAADAKDRFFEIFLKAIDKYDLLASRKICLVPSRN
jgi:hypothetical protein